MLFTWKSHFNNNDTEATITEQFQWNSLYFHKYIESVMGILLHKPPRSSFDPLVWHAESRKIFLIKRNGLVNLYIFLSVPFLLCIRFSSTFSLSFLWTSCLSLIPIENHDPICWPFPDTLAHPFAQDLAPPGPAHGRAPYVNQHRKELLI